MKDEKKIKRLDSTQNRETLVLTALQLFKEKGVEIPLSDIAKSANVSRMTFYRHFPDRNAIVAAVFNYNLDRLEEEAQNTSKDANAFFKLLQIILLQRVEYHKFIPYIDHQSSLQTSKRLSEIFIDPILKAQKANLLRKDFDAEKDLVILVMMMGGAVSYPEIQNIERTMDLILNGLKGDDK